MFQNNIKIKKWKSIHKKSTWVEFLNVICEGEKVIDDSIPPPPPILENCTHTHAQSMYSIPHTWIDGSGSRSESKWEWIRWRSYRCGVGRGGMLEHWCDCWIRHVFCGEEIVIDVSIFCPSQNVDRESCFKFSIPPWQTNESPMQSEYR